MSGVARLGTFVDARDDVADARRMSVSARHEAVLPDGRRVLLLDDLGWTASLHTAGKVPDVDSEDMPDIRDTTSVEDIEERARIVVGPDEPFEGRSQDDMEADHWAYLPRSSSNRRRRGRPRVEAATA